MGLEDQKRAAALAALDYVKPGMRLGLGTGTSASQFVIALGERMRDGLEVVGVPTSAATEALARTHGVTLTTLDRVPHLDLTVDGADEIDGSLRLIKGGGGALLREKIVAAASEVMIVIADSSKRVDTLGAFPLPVEIVPFGARATMRMIEAIAKDCGCEGEVLLRVKETEPFQTENGNLICDCAFNAIVEPERLAGALSSIPGVVEHGLFINMASLAIIGTPSGIKVLGR
jgi:ribose 5-phosphate isomerase A